MECLSKIIIILHINRYQMCKYIFIVFVLHILLAFCYHLLKGEDTTCQCQSEAALSSVVRAWYVYKYREYLSVYSFIQRSQGHN